MAHLWRRSLLTRVLAGVLAFFFAGCGASEIDNAPDGSTLTFNPTDWDIEFAPLACSAYVDRRTSVLTLRNADGLPLDDVPVTVTSHNPVFGLIAADGTILTPDAFGTSSYTLRTDKNGNVLVRVAVADCEAEDDIIAMSGTAVGALEMEVSDASSSTGTPPVADATASPANSGAAPFPVTFDASGSTDDGTIVSYDWDFDDAGATDTGQTVSHTFNSAGTYNVLLTVTDDDGLSDTFTIVITVS